MSIHVEKSSREFLSREELKRIPFQRRAQENCFSPKYSKAPICVKLSALSSCQISHPIKNDLLV
jgi:hypothetical protein